MTYLERLKASERTYADFKAWLEHECDGEEESEALAEEYCELLSIFNPLNLKY